MIVTFTDFGPAGPYLGQMRAVIAAKAPGLPVIDLLSDAPVADPFRAAYLLAALDDGFAPGTVFLAVVDPGVGGPRPPVALFADGLWYVGPGNGLFELVRRRSVFHRLYEITWRPKTLSVSFHGRDLFAPVALRLALGEPPPAIERSDALDPAGRDWPDDLAEIVYLDHYGNAVTGLRAGAVEEGAPLAVGDRRIGWARTFSEAPTSDGFWYVNSSGLIEIAMPHGRADQALGLSIGTKVEAR